MIVQLLVQYIIVWYVWKHCTQCVFLGSHDVKEWCGWLWKEKKNGMYLKWRNGPPVMPANGTTSESPGHERYDSPNLKTATDSPVTGSCEAACLQHTSWRLDSKTSTCRCHCLMLLWWCFLIFLDLRVDLEEKKTYTWHIGAHETSSEYHL